MKKRHFQQKLIISLLTLVLMMSCDSKKKMNVQGHRGCRGLMPENSLAAFEKGIDLGVETLELDIVISKDGKVVVSHEPYMNPVICLSSEGTVIPDSSEGAYNLYKMNYDEIKTFDCGTKFHPIYPNQEKFKTYKPLISEVFDLVKTKKSNVKFNIEIKSDPSYYDIFTPQPEAYVALILEEINKHDMLSRINLQSFDIAILEEVKVQARKIPLALLVEDDEIINEKLNLLSFQPEIISPYFKLLSEASISNYQKEGFQVIPWTVNTETDMKQMIAWNVDGIITDYPNVLIKILKL
ncbi:glycerophosphodiester phosphodiesterase [Winogradskyella wichelsiae]|uniref:glycerophosphodiester phosphodiesterase n=1 Tax=Winogradskyella wichelsiae TaxID=2697007 RepID=UPI001FE9117B|nr:glycerophosphodiester phosphodiesterase [Winogradskyella wichelsiae]